MAEAATKLAPATPPPPPPTPPPAPNPFGGGGPPPNFAYGMTFREIGQSGLRAYSGYIREEFLPELQGRQGIRTYREMYDNSPIIGAMIWAIQSTLQKVDWRTNAAADTPQAQEMADFADSLRDDMSSPWEEVIIEANSMLVYGFAPLEIVYKKRLGKKPGPDPDRPGKELPRSDFDDGRIGWRKLALRGQDTILKWFLDRNGEIEGFTQQPWVGPLIDVPIEKCLLFRPVHYKNNPEGRSILRSAYRNYYLSKRIEEQEAILFERLNGIPVIKVPMQLMEQAKAGDAGAASAMELFKKIAINLRVDEQMGVVLPSDTFVGPNGYTNVAQYSLELVAPGGQGGRSSVTANDTLQRHATNMLISLLADFIMLGHSQRGTQALSVSKIDMFFQAIEGFLNAQAGIFNRHGLTRIWDLNGLDSDSQPEYEPDLAQRVDLDVLSNFVLRLSQAGMPIFPNKDVESALLDIGGLPDIQDPTAIDTLHEQPPVPVVGPLAALHIATNKPPPQAPVGPDGKPVEPADTPFGKMVMASIARRMLKMAGPSTPIGRGKRKRRPPRPAETVATWQQPQLDLPSE